MTDVIQIAKERRVRLATELAKLDDFIRMAEALVEWSQSKSGKVSGIEEVASAGPAEPGSARSGAAAAGSTAKN